MFFFHVLFFLAAKVVAILIARYTDEKIHCDAPRAWGPYFQDHVSPQVEALFELHYIFYYLVAISVLLLGIVFMSNYYLPKGLLDDEEDVKKPDDSENKKKCTHPVIARKNLTGDIDFQMYKNLKCVGEKKVINGINDYRGSVCTSCGKLYCGNHTCICRRNNLD